MLSAVNVVAFCPWLSVSSLPIYVIVVHIRKRPACIFMTTVWQLRVNRFYFYSLCIWLRKK